MQGPVSKWQLDLVDGKKSQNAPFLWNNGPAQGQWVWHRHAMARLATTCHRCCVLSEMKR